MQRNNPAVAKFYNSPQWKKARKAYKNYRYGLCERCGQPGYIVHHKCYISSENIYNPEITLNFDNLELLCIDCHNKEHFELREFTIDGDVKDKHENILSLAGVYK